MAGTERRRRYGQRAVAGEGDVVKAPRWWCVQVTVKSHTKSGSGGRNGRTGSANVLAKEHLVAKYLMALLCVK
ncbi:hypothetical protein ACLK1S_04025 [Escherichia coli]